MYCKCGGSLKHYKEAVNNKTVEYHKCSVCGRVVNIKVEENEN